MHDHLYQNEDYYDAMNRWYEYEFREWKVDCLVCLNADCDTQIELERKGWELTQHGEYCPDCAKARSH